MSMSAPLRADWLLGPHGAFDGSLHAGKLLLYVHMNDVKHSSALLGFAECEALKGQT